MSNLEFETATDPINNEQIDLDTEISDSECYIGDDCFNEGTKILCVNELGVKMYVPIEKLTPGMLVETYKTGPKHIEIIGKSTRPNDGFSNASHMYKMHRNDEMIDDLIVTGGHSILVDRNELTTEQKLIQIKKYKLNFAIEDKKGSMACLSEKFVKISDKRDFTRYNFALSSPDGDKRYGVYANGVLCEVPSCKLIKSIHFDSYEIRK